MLPKLESIEVLFPAAAYIFQTSAIIIAALSRDGQTSPARSSQEAINLSVFPRGQERERGR